MTHDPTPRELAGTWPAEWATDGEYGPALIALDKLHAMHWIRDDPGGLGWHIDFEGLWERGPCSHGERILIALAWCLFNFGWARDQEQKDRADGRPGPVTVANPGEAAGVLSGSWWKTYDAMVALARGPLL